MDQNEKLFTTHTSVALGLIAGIILGSASLDWAGYQRGLLGTLAGAVGSFGSLLSASANHCSKSANGSPASVKSLASGALNAMLHAAALRRGGV